MSDIASEVYRALREAQNKYTYFLLAAAGAGIALAVTKTDGAAMGISQIPLALAVASWGLSFLLGCRHIAYVNSSLYSNAVLLQVESGQHPEAGTNPTVVAAASKGIRQALEHNSKRANKLGQWQFRMLVIGAVFYILWHILEMSLRSMG